MKESATIDARRMNISPQGALLQVALSGVVVGSTTKIYKNELLALSR